MSVLMKQTLPESGKTKKPKRLKKIIKFTFYSSLLSAVLGALLITGLYLYISPSLPSIESLKDVRFQVPLRIYSADGKLIGEFGEKRRSPLEYEEIPQDMINGILGAEDDRFFEHPGVDYHGILRAVKVMIITGEKAQGGSTITMQVARNFFLSNEKTFLRKFSEIFLSFRIEEELSKEEILTLYLNKIYLGNRSYGVGAAAKMYYGKSIDKLNVAQLAMIAGLPKAPSKYNPIVNPTRALIRRNYVLGRMLHLNYLSKEEYDKSIVAPVTASLHLQSIGLDAPYAAEMVRKEMIDRFGNDAYTEGYNVYTTLDSHLQNQAARSLRYNLLAYEERHGYRGPETHLDPLQYSDPEEWDAALKKLEKFPLLKPGVVIGLDDQHAYIYTKEGQVVELCWKGMKWAAPYVKGNAPGPKPKNAYEIFAVGDVVRLYDAGGGRWSLGQMPEVEGALVSISSHDGAIQSIVGGYDFYHSKFNRAAQAKRQPGSNFKPFVYSAALEKGYTAATLINDAPVVFNDPGLEESWRPENYSGKFFGPTRLREALVKSRNLVSIRILRSIGVSYAIDYVKRFGFDPAELPKDLSLALGSATVTPLSIAQGYATFANGGYAVEPYLITRIVDSQDSIVYAANPAVVCPSCEEDLLSNGSNNSLLSSQDESKPLNLAKRIITEENAYIVTTIMRDIILRGTGRRALVLKRDDLAGKTGTTNDQRDAWFSGFNADIVTTAWVGFDKPHPLGDFESGARAALPMWISYMREALKDVPEKPLVQPQGIVTVRIDPETGLLAGGDFPNAIFESFRKKNVPKQSALKATVGPSSGAENSPEEMSEQLF